MYCQCIKWVVFSSSKKYILCFGNTAATEQRRPGWQRMYMYKKSVERHSAHCRRSTTHLQTRETLLFSWTTERSQWLQSVVSAPVAVRIRAPSVWDSGITAIRPLKGSGRDRLTDTLFKGFQLPAQRLQSGNASLKRNRETLLLTLRHFSRQRAGSPKWQKKKSIFSPAVVI